MIAIYAITALFAFFFQAFFTSAEMALTSASRIRLRKLAESGDARAKKANELLSGMGSFLGTTLVGTNICVIAASALVTRVFDEYVDMRYSGLLATAVTVPLILIVAEIVPKIIARHYATSFALYLARPLSNFQAIFRPLIAVINSASRLLLAPFRTRAVGWDVTITKGDLKSLLLSGHESGALDHDELKLMHAILDLGSKPVEGFMIPMYKVSAISSDDTISSLKKAVSLTGFTRVPVYSQAKDNIVGIVNIYDVLFSGKKGIDAEKVGAFIRKPVLIGGSDSLDGALGQLKKAKQPMGIVTDKAGRAVGVITIEDILEHLVGKIEDNVK